jgi:hypothetical protein
MHVAGTVARTSGNLLTEPAHLHLLKPAAVLPELMELIFSRSLVACDAVFQFRSQRRTCGGFELTILLSSSIAPSGSICSSGDLAQIQLDADKG